MVEKKQASLTGMDFANLFTKKRFSKYCPAKKTGRSYNKTCSKGLLSL